MIRKIIKALLKKSGIDLVSYNEQESMLLKSLPAEINYKDLQCIKALSGAGQLSLEEAIFLGELTRRANGPGPLIEIGTLFGFSTRTIVMHKRKEQKFYTVDNYGWNPLGINSEAHFLATQAALREATADFGVIQVRADKRHFFDTYDDASPELVFLDADHSYEGTKADLEWAKRIGAKIICGDDYHPVRFPGVARAVDEMGGPMELRDCLFVL